MLGILRQFLFTQYDKMIWTIEKRKQGNEIWVSSNVKLESILVGEGYTKKEYKRSMELAQVIVNALNERESVCEFRRKQGIEQL